MENCPVYLDDGVILSNNVDVHIKHAREMFTTLVGTGVTLKINKCHFVHRQVEYLGFMVKPGCIEIDKTDVASHCNLEPPKKRTHIISF